MSPQTQTVETDAEPAVELKRVFAATPERLFSAWTEAEALAAWKGPESMTTTVDVLEMKVGGCYRFVMTGEEGDMAGVETIVEVDFKATDAGTEITVLHRRLPSEEAREAHTGGWNSSFVCLDRHLAETA
ncbi:MAG TPA: SRPBCC domain-containing protein [Rhodospirillales bacterium]|jgi:uncharacterized protein YndB with AHSA1/START domain|nr:SRPBCC domain-containing protein [Rhodospirillales bacterium]